MGILDRIYNFLFGDDEKAGKQPIQKTANPTPAATEEPINPLDAHITADEKITQQTQTILQNMDTEAFVQELNQHGDLKHAFSSWTSLEEQTLRHQNTQTSEQALLKRFANVTAFFEAESDAEITQQVGILDTPSIAHSARFYNCKGDKHPGLTIGYGSYFKKDGAITDEDAKELLPHLKLCFSNGENKGDEVFFIKGLDKKGKEAPVAVSKLSLSAEEIKAGTAYHEQVKREKVTTLLKNMGTTKNPNKKVINDFEYEIDKSSALNLLYTRYQAKKTDMKRDKLLGDKKRDILVEWLATDMYYQGELTRYGCHHDFRENKIDKQKLPEASLPVCDKKGRQLKNKKGNPIFTFSLRRLSRRIIADLHTDKIKKYPFTKDMDAATRQAHADLLSKHCAAYVTQMIGHKHEIHYNLPNTNKLAEELTTLALIQIKTEQLERDLTAQEIAATRLEAQELTTPYLSLESSGQKKRATESVVNETEKLLAKSGRKEVIRQAKTKQTGILTTLNNAGQKVITNQNTKQKHQPKKTVAGR